MLNKALDELPVRVYALLSRNGFSDLAQGLELFTVPKIVIVCLRWGERLLLAGWKLVIANSGNKIQPTLEIIFSQLWKRMRFEADYRDAMGQFILTGSAVPADKQKIGHSGTGRFAWLTMRLGGIGVTMEF